MKPVAKSISLFSICLGWLLLALGLLLSVGETNSLLSPTFATSVSNNILSIVAKLPGVPFDMTELGASSPVVSGIIVWILGLDIVLLGFGLWMRSRFARYVGITVFGLAAFFDFVEFLMNGFVGASASVIEMMINSTVLYYLFKREIWIDVRSVFVRSDDSQV